MTTTKNKIQQAIVYVPMSYWR